MLIHIILIGVCYHSTSASTEEEQALHALISKACEMNDNVMICGDFNHRTIDWDLLHSQAEGQAFLDLSLDCYLVQKVNEPTRGENILDLVLVSDENMVENVKVSEPFGTSDHNVITYDLVCNVELKKLEEDVLRLPQCRLQWNEELCGKYRLEFSL